MSSDSSPEVPASNVTTSANTKGPAEMSQTNMSGSDGAVELDRMKSSEDEVKLPLHEDIMQLAMLGEIGPIQKLIEEGKYAANHKDKEGITPLHWAAINNHYALCQYLVDSGVDVNVKGGESYATPAMWAAQRCHYYTVSLLLQRGADPLITDAQGYNILHLATHDGNVFLLIYLLLQNIPVDAPDPQGHTCLMWAGYKGYPAVVDLFLRWGAKVNAVDQEGFTPLHWSLVKGNTACIQKLVECGSDRFAETSSGKTPTITAEEMGSTAAWHRALRQCGFQSDGIPRKIPFPFPSIHGDHGFYNKFFFSSPFLLLIYVFFIFSKVMVFAAVMLSAFIIYGFQYFAQQLLRWAPSDMKDIQKTPYLAGIFAASLFWVGARWLQTILPVTWTTAPFFNLLFLLSYGLCAYFYVMSMIEDPGYIPKPASRSQQKSIVDELLSLWKYDDQSFCVHCVLRKPLRSKHCRKCNRCVAKLDHHCPWVHNCVAANNLRHFLLYIISLEIGIIIFAYLAWTYLNILPEPAEIQCYAPSKVICSYILRDPLTVIITIWACLQLVWVTMLLTVQTIQIARAVTTFESMRGNTHHDSKVSEAATAMMTSGATSMSGAQLTTTGMGPDPVAPGHRPQNRRKEGFLSQWKKLLGLDTFVATAKGKAGSGRGGNPFSRGAITNCKDFWCDSSPYFARRETGAAMLGGEVVNYTRMYEAPSRMRRPRRDGESGMYHSLGTDDAV